MKTKEAFQTILKRDKNANKYRLAKALGCSHVTISNYVNGKTRISKEIYDRFQKIYPSMTIDDVWDPNDYVLGVLE